MIAKLLRVSAWPFATKLSVAFCAQVLVLSACVAYYNRWVAVRRDVADEKETLQDLAAATAGRLDQFIIDTKQVIDATAGDDEVAELLAMPIERRLLAKAHAPEASPEDVRIFESVQSTLDKFYRKKKKELEDSIPGAIDHGADGKSDQFVKVNLYDKLGRVVVSTTHDIDASSGASDGTPPGQRLKRATFRLPLSSPGECYVSSLHIAQSEPSASFMSFTQGVQLRETGEILGIFSFAINRAVLGYMIPELRDPTDFKSKDGEGGALHRSLDECTARGEVPSGRQVFIVDRRGAVLLPRCGPSDYYYLDDDGMRRAQADAANHVNTTASLDYEDPFAPLLPTSRFASHQSPALMDLLEQALVRETTIYDRNKGRPAYDWSPLWTTRDDRLDKFARVVPWEGRRRLVAVHPVEEMSRHGWHVVFTEDYERWIEPLETQNFQVLIVFLLVLGGGGSVIMTLLVRLLTRQTKELLAGTQAVAEGAFDTRIAVLSEDELGRLAGSFNDMAARVGAAYERAEAERRSAERARKIAEEANHAKDRILANSSHELRTPLNSIIGYGEILLEDAEAESRDAEALDLRRIVTQGKRLLGIVNDILDLSKLDAGKMELHVDNIAVQKVVDGVVDTVEPIMAKNANKLRVSVEPDIGRVRADENRLHQCLLNLLGNASKFTSKGTIHLHVARDGANIAFGVSDTGIGMTPAQMHKLFQPFAQAEATTSSKYGGTGLGLSVTKALCELMEGSIEVASEPGKGSTFTIKLPSTGAVQPHEPSADAGGAAPPQPGVLYVGVDAAARAAVGRAVASAGFGLSVAADRDEAARLLAHEHPIAVVIDADGPATHAPDLLATLRADAVHRSTPVLALGTRGEARFDALAQTPASAEHRTLAKPAADADVTAALARLGVVSKDHPLVIAEDDPTNRSLTRKILEKAGWRVVEVEDGTAALHAVETLKPAALLMDLAMPGIDGFELASRLEERADLRRIPVVVITALDTSDADRARLTSNVREIFQKGKYAREQLVSRVRQLVAEKLEGDGA